MKAPILWLALAFAAGCSGRDTVGESWSQYYPQPYDETQATGVERKEILAWLKDPKERRRIGYLEKYEIILQGTRTKREFYYILDPGGRERIGFATEYGEFFRYRRDGTKEKLGAYPVFDVGLKVFFGLTHEHVIRLEAIDPYRD